MCMLHIALCAGVNATIPFGFGFLTMNQEATNFASWILFPILRPLTRVQTNA